MMLKVTLFTLGVLLLLPVKAEIQRDTLFHRDIDEVTIETSRTNARLRDLPQKVEVIGPGIIAHSPAINVADLLKMHTGLDIIQYPGVSTSIGLRGFSPSAHSRSYTLFLINGVPSATTNAASIPLVGIDRVEIIKGPLSSLYGSDAMGGVINIITRQTEFGKGGGNIGYAAGNFGTRRFSGHVAAPVSGSSTISFGFSKNEQDSDYRIGRRHLLSQPPLARLILDENSYGGVMLNSRLSTNELAGRVATRLNDNWTSSIDLLYFGADDIAMPGSFWGVYGQSKKDLHRMNLVGSIKGQSGRHSIMISPYFGSETERFFSDNSDTAFVSLDSQTREFGVRVHDNINLGFAKLLVGADVDIYEYNSNRFSGPSNPANPYQPDYYHEKIAGLVQLSRTFDRLHLNAGARWDHITYRILANQMLGSAAASETHNTINPSFGLRYDLPWNISLRSSFGTGFSVPDAFRVAGFYSVSEYFPEWDFWWVANYEGNPDLGPERSATIDLGVRYSNPDRLLVADLTWFRTRHTDRIVEYNFTRQDNQGQDVEITTYRNAGQSNHQGVELMASSDLGALFNNRFRLELFSNFTFMLDATFDRQMANGENRSFDMLYVRRQTGNFGITYDNLDGFNTRLNGRLIGQRLERDRFSAIRPGITPDQYYTGGGYTPADRILLHPRHVVFDWSVFYTLGGNKRFGVTVSNLLDENYAEKDGYNMPGRMLTGSFNFLF